MIKSDIVKIKKVDNFDNLYIETELEKCFKSIIRWAITEVDSQNLTVSVSYEA